MVTGRLLKKVLAQLPLPRAYRYLMFQKLGQYFYDKVFVVFVFKDLTYTTFPLFSALQDIRLIIRHIFIRVVFDAIFDSLFYDALLVTQQYSVDDRVKRER
jgi:hypothetical protein